MKIKILSVNIRSGFFLLVFLSHFSLYAQVNIGQSGDAGHAETVRNSDPTVSLVYKDTLIIPSFTEFNFPVKMKSEYDISAISLGLYFPSAYLEITGVELAHGAQGFSFNVSGGLFSLAWSDIIPLNIIEDDTLIMLSMRSLDIDSLEGTIKLVLDESSEFGDSSANIIEGIVLEVPEINYLVPDTNDFLAGIYPNPFNEYTSINFYLETESKVKISLFNIIGMEIRLVADATYPEGEHQVRLYAHDLSKGLYLLKFEIRNSEGSKTKLIKIISIG